MSSNDGGPAFPALTMLCGSDTVVASCHNSAQPGMSLRDWFAGKALPAIIAEYHTDLRSDGETVTLIEGTAAIEIAHESYAMADAMIAARKAEGGGT